MIERVGQSEALRLFDPEFINPGRLYEVPVEYDLPHGGVPDEEWEIVHELSYSEQFPPAPLDDTDGDIDAGRAPHFEEDAPGYSPIDPDFDHEAYMQDMVDGWQALRQLASGRLSRARCLEAFLVQKGTGFLHPQQPAESVLDILPDQLGVRDEKLAFASDLIQAAIAASKKGSLFELPGAERVVPFGMRLAQELRQEPGRHSHIVRSAGVLQLRYVENLQPMIDRAMRQHGGSLDADELSEIRSEVELQIYKTLSHSFDFSNDAYGTVAGYLKQRIYGSVADYVRKHSPLDLPTFKLIRRARRAVWEAEAEGGKVDTLKVACAELSHLRARHVRWLLSLSMGSLARPISLDEEIESSRTRAIRSVGEIIADPREMNPHILPEEYETIAMLFTEWQEELAKRNGHNTFPPETQARAAFAHYVQEYRYDEIAKHLGIPERDVRNICLKFLAYCKRYDADEVS